VAGSALIHSATVRFQLLGSGSSGNATLVEAGDTRLLLDAGLGARALAELLQSAGVDPSSLDAILLSHEHEDHAKGALGLSRKWGVPIVSTRGTYVAAGYAEAGFEGWRELEIRVPLRIGACTVLGVPLPHDAASPVAFVISDGAATLGHATDFGHVTRGLADAFVPCDAVVLESNYDPDLLREGPYPYSLKQRILGARGHLANADVARYLQHGLGAACRTLVLAHLSRTNNDPELAEASAAVALRRRPEVKLTISASDGADWIDIVPPATPAYRPPRQLTLF
jgi:phosphoribosyl 1,2-cyclic phosphodiesterase